jgi:hypothetical protein
VATTAVTTATTTEATAAPTTAPTTEATTVAPTTTTITTTAAPTTVPVTKPTFDPSIPVLELDAEIRGVEAFFDYGDYTYKVQVRSDRASVVDYIGDDEEVVVLPNTTVQYVYNDKLYVAKIDSVTLFVYRDNPHIKTVRWHPEATYDISGHMRTADWALPSHIYLPKNISLSAEQFLRGDSAMSDKNLFWYNIIGTPSFGALTEPLHLYLIKGAPLTELLYNERAYFPYGWELDFSEEGTYCFYTQKDGKDDIPVYFHVAESFE